MRQQHQLPNSGESVGELVSRLTREVSDLVSSHMELARVEITSDLRRAGKGAGMLGGAGVAGYVALLLASVAAAVGLGEVVPLWAGFLIVAGIWALAAGILALVGRKELDRMTPIAENTKREFEHDRDWVKRRSA
ncbi:MAG TPA: phage holin family protein [Acidimicrobiia bacterium]|jgi:uncharacterized membrane protein YqjE|nr:phage holin family protein [Acidimicrobiia bacterium]